MAEREIHTFTFIPEDSREGGTQFWALTPKQAGRFEGSRITKGTLRTLAYLSFFGVGHTPDIAVARMEAAVSNPRQTQSTYYYEPGFTFVEAPAPARLPLTVITYSPARGEIGSEILIEAFEGEETHPIDVVTHYGPLLTSRPVTEKGLHPFDQIEITTLLENKYPVYR